MHGDALLLGFGVVACAAITGMTAVAIVAITRTVASMVKAVFFTLLFRLNFTYKRAMTALYMSFA
jgi:hypothetical protein